MNNLHAKRKGDGVEKVLDCHQWITNPRGATATEYLIIIVCCSLGLLGAIQLFGGGLHHQFESASNFMSFDSDDDSARQRQQSRQGSGMHASRQDPPAQGEVVREADEEVELVDAPDGPDRDHVPIRAEPEGASGSVGGINPLVLILLIGGVLFLGYIVFSDD